MKNLDNDKAAKIEIIPSETISTANDNDGLIEDEETDVVCDLADVTSKFHQNRKETRSISSSTSTIHPGEERQERPGQAADCQGGGQCQDENQARHQANYINKSRYFLWLNRGHGTIVIFSH